MNFHNIAIIKLSSLGDIIHTLPAVNLLREQFKEAKISWIVAPAGAKLLKNFSGLDNIIEINLKIPGPIGKFLEIKRIISNYRKTFDLVLDFQGLLKSAILGSLLGGYFLGFHKDNLREPLSRFFYNDQGEKFDDQQHVIFKNIHLLKKITAPSSPPDLRTFTPTFPLKKRTESPKLKEFKELNNLDTDNYIILNVGGGWETKTLDIAQNIEIIKTLQNHGEKKIVILWGNNKEKEKASRICYATGAILSVFLSFSDLILLIKSARVIITGDTLALHLADLVKTPSIGIFGPTSQKETAPYYQGVSLFLKKILVVFVIRRSVIQ